jgi:hypothetical protein
VANVASHLPEQAVEQTHLKRAMVWHRYVVLSPNLRGYPNMRARLAHNLITELPQRANQLKTGAITGDSHAASTSSRT